MSIRAEGIIFWTALVVGVGVLMALAFGLASVVTRLVLLP